MLLAIILEDFWFLYKYTILNLHIVVQIQHFAYCKSRLGFSTFSLLGLCFYLVSNFSSQYSTQIIVYFHLYEILLIRTLALRIMNKLYFNLGSILDGLIIV